MSPRPILKRAEPQSPTPRYTQGSLFNHHSPSHVVHFPPSPSLTRTFSAYSPALYDRSPIVVSPNTCALPERGCPGRTYTLDDPTAQSSHAKRRPTVQNGRHLHPRAVASAYREQSPDTDEDADEDEGQRTPTHTFPPVPSLIPDLSSESDESDGFTSPPPETTAYHNPASYFPPPHPYPIVAPSHPPIPYAPHRSISYSNDDPQGYFSGTPNPLSFLPHPPSPSDEGQKARRRKQRGQSRSRDERQNPRRGADGSYKSLSVCNALANCSLEGTDDGCLGGF
jgi:hypothetical protein